MPELKFIPECVCKVCFNETGIRSCGLRRKAPSPVLLSDVQFCKAGENGKIEEKTCFLCLAACSEMSAFSHDSDLNSISFVAPAFLVGQHNFICCFIIINHWFLLVPRL